MFRRVVLTIWLLTTAGSAYAHSPLKTTVPANGAQLDAAPAAITLTFGKKARLTKVTVEGDGTDPVRLELPTKSFALRFEMNGAPEAAGAYTVKWRALGTDGHVLTGAFGYTVQTR